MPQAIERKTNRRKRYEKPETSFWVEKDGQQVLKQYMDEKLETFVTTKMLNRFLKNAYKFMIREAISKNIAGQFVTKDKVSIGVQKDSDGNFFEIKKKILFDFSLKSPSKGILLVD